MIARVSALPPLGDLPGCGSDLAYVEAGGCKEVTLPDTGLPAQIVWLTGWQHVDPRASRGNDAPVAESFTAVRCAVPELVGRVGSFAAGPEALEDGSLRVVCSSAAARDLEFVQALVAGDFESLMLREPLGTRAPGHVHDVVQDERTCLVYATGNLVARVRGDERGSDAIGQLVSILDAAIIRAAELAPGADDVGSHVELAEPQDLEPGAASLEDARRLLRERRSRGFLRRDHPQAEGVARAFAQSYAEASNFRSEDVRHAAVELPRYGVRGDPVVSVVGVLPDGRAVRLAHTTGWISLPRTSQRRAPVERHSYDVAVTRVSDAERLELDHRLSVPLPGEPGAWLAGELLVVVRPAQSGAVTAAGLDAVRDEAARHVERSHVHSMKPA